MSNFIPINIVPNYKFKNKRPAWATPDFNPAIADKSFYETLAEGLSPQTQKQLLELQRQMNPQSQPQVTPMGAGGVQKDPRATIQLPNGQFVTPQQYQQLLQKLKQRTSNYNSNMFAANEGYNYNFDEANFQKGIRETEWFKEFVKEYGEEPDLDTSDYDYRKAWAAGIRPEKDPYDKNRYHWASSLENGEMLKAADHPTAWKEYYMRVTGKNPDAVGATKEDYLKLISK